MAWIRATCPGAQYRNGREATSAATRACELSHWKRRDYLQTLAAAYAESGSFQLAVHWQEKAISLISKEDPELGQYREKLGLFKSSKQLRAAGD